MCRVQAQARRLRKLLRVQAFVHDRLRIVMFMKPIEMPAARQLKKDYDELKTITAVAEKYGVSTTTVANWFKRMYGRTPEQELKA